MTATPDLVDSIRRRELEEQAALVPANDRFEGYKPRLWSDVYEITRAGSLVLELLAEARLVEPRALRHPLPPPPPGWLDPRPKLRLRSDGDGAVLLPSDRETANGADVLEDPT